MKILYDWLKEFVDVQFPPAELRERLSLAGIAVEGISQTPAGPLLDSDLTINRPDCLGHYGMAREVAALVRGRVKPIDARLAEISDAAATATHVDVDSPDLCGRYTARILRGVKVQPSPDWLRRRLEALGHASINNVVDATNYVMLELGHPMHAFDLDRLAEHRLIVRRARAGEKIRALDGVEYSLSAEMCVIADVKHAVAIAGTIGGAESEITLATRDVLLESAWFDPISIRRTSKALGLRTEASTRFERGADPEMAETASRRCAELIRELAGGEVLAGVVDVYPSRREPLSIRLSQTELVRLMGAKVPDTEIESILGALGFQPRRMDSAAVGVTGSSGAIWQCTQPPWRQDVAREVDLIEEVVRHYGLDKFPARLHASKQPSARLPYSAAEDRLRERLIGLGYHEIVTIPLVNDEEDAQFRSAGADPARITNPLAADASILRSNGLVSMVHALSWNLKRGQRNVRLFEIGRAYRFKDSAPVETRILTVGATGMSRVKQVAESAREYEFADLKGDLDQLGELAGGICWRPTPAKLGWGDPARSGEFSVCRAAATGHANANPDMQRPSNAALGSAGQLSRRVAEIFKLRQNVFLAELSLDPFYAASQQALASRQYHPISRFPAVERDFSLILDDGTPFVAVAETIHALNIAQITSVEPVDLFRGKLIPAGKFSLLVRVTFQSTETTLTEAQVNEFWARIVAALEEKLGAALRSA